MKVLHVVPRLSGGGPSTSVLAEARHGGATHEMLVLEQAASSVAMLAAMRARVRVHVCPSKEREAEVVNGADVVVVHFWNTPSLARWLVRWQQRALRWVLYCRVNGVHAPQVLPEELAQSPCHLVLTSPHLMRPGASLIPAPVDPALLSAGADVTDVLHVGTVNVFKLDPAFGRLHTGLQTTVIGTGGQEAEFATSAATVHWAGFQPMPWTTRARVFSAPTSRFTYASSDKTLQEAMLLGIPVVTYYDSPVAHLVTAETGLLAKGREDYSEVLREAMEVFDRSAVAQAAHELHDPAAKWTHLRSIYEQVADGEPRPVSGRLTAGDGARTRPGLRELEDDEVLWAFQQWACEGGRAQYLDEAHHEL